MTSKLYIKFRENGFWMFDVPKDIFLKHLIDSANHHLNHNQADWLRPAIEHWNVNIIVNEFGFHLNEQWSQNQIDVVSHLIDEVCDQLSERTVIYASEIKSWKIENRGIDQVRTERVIELGRAIQALLREELPAAPEGMDWFYGTSGRSIITHAAIRDYLWEYLDDDLKGGHLYIYFRENGFWAFAAAKDIFLSHLIDRANNYVNINEFEWLCEAIMEWEINLFKSFDGMYLDEKWTQNQFNLMLDIIDEVCEQLSEYSIIPAAEWKCERLSVYSTIPAAERKSGVGWNIIQKITQLFSEPVIRYHPIIKTTQFPSEPVIELGRAIQTLLREDLPVVPDGKMWLYGTKDGRIPIDRYKPRSQKI